MKSPFALCSLSSGGARAHGQAAALCIPGEGPRGVSGEACREQPHAACAQPGQDLRVCLSFPAWTLLLLKSLKPHLDYCSPMRSGPAAPKHLTRTCLNSTFHAVCLLTVHTRQWEYPRIQAECEMPGGCRPRLKYWMDYVQEHPEEISKIASVQKKVRIRGVHTSFTLM